jgi:hypothetical protein
MGGRGARVGVSLGVMELGEGREEDQGGVWGSLGKAQRRGGRGKERERRVPGGGAL